MASSRSIYSDGSLYVLGLLSILLLIQRGGAYEFKVGGSSGWSVPSDAQSYNQWAGKNRFQIGDTLLFEYPPEKDSVLQVTKEHYTDCTTDDALANFTNGHTVFKFNRSGPFYFISGTKDNCLKNQKLHVVVLADRTGTKSSPPPPPTPSPAPTPAGGEVPSPPAGSNPSPAPTPADGEIPPPPTESNPSPAPASDEAQAHSPPKSGGPLLVVSSVGLCWAFVGLSIVLGL